MLISLVKESLLIKGYDDGRVEAKYDKNLICFYPFGANE